MTLKRLKGSITPMDSLATIRRLARGGAAQRAWDRFCAAGFDRQGADPALLTLKGRLLKDLAMGSAGTARIAHLRASAEAYAAAGALCEDSYPRINAATLVYLRGDRATAAMLAADLLTLLDAGQQPGETPYWQAATRAEAYLLCGRLAEAQRALAEAVALAPDAREDRAATLRQFRRILAAGGEDAAWLDAFALRPVLHFSGPLALLDDAAEAVIADAVARINPGIAFGALAAGTDIVAAEAAIAAGAELHIVLPASVSAFRAASVLPVDAAWGARFDAMLAAAHRVEVIDEPGGLTAASVRLADVVAIGRAIDAAAASDGLPILLRSQEAGLYDPQFRIARHQELALDIARSDNCGAATLPAPDQPMFWLSAADGTARALTLAQLDAAADHLALGTVIDFAVSAEADSVPPRLAALQDCRRDDALLASDFAAQALIAHCPDLRPVLSGSRDGASGSFDVYDVIQAGASSMITPD